MALFEMHAYSKSLGIQVTVNVIIPQRSNTGEIGVGGVEKSNSIKCLYLLHGLSDDQSIWLRRSSIERYAQESGICVVMPCGDRSFYTDMKYGGKYFTYISEELPALIHEFFDVSDRREDNFIAGLSMGGYGALKIGMRCCDRFSAAAGMSSVADIVASTSMFPSALVPVFGEELEVPEDEDLLKLAEQTNSNPNKPRIFMGVGTEDSLYKQNQTLRAKFESLDYDFTYRESKGAHEWGFWDEYIRYIICWLLK